MNPSWKLLPKILSREKTIESRWYKHRIAPWNRIVAGDTVYFKDSGKPVTVVAEVEKVLQFDITSNDILDHIIDTYNYGIQLKNPEKRDWFVGKKYCILVFLQNPKVIEPFKIDRTGYGTGSAWITVENIEKLRLT